MIDLDISAPNFTRTSKLVQQTLATGFKHPDIGPLDEALEVDHFVVCQPKCATTAIQRGLERLGRRVIHAHTNATTFAAFPRGWRLRNAGIGMEDIIRTRLASRRQTLYHFFGFREPVSWYLSVAGQFRVPLNRNLADNFERNFEFSYPWNNYRIDELSRLITDAYGIRILDVPFDHDEGLVVAEVEGAKIVIYRFDRLDAVQTYIRQAIDERFELAPERVNHSASYRNFVESFALPPGAVAQLKADRWFRHFYSGAEQQHILRSYGA